MYWCPDCGRAQKYGDSHQRHRAVCHVRLRDLVRRLADALEPDPLHRISKVNQLEDGKLIAEARAVLNESGKGR